MRSGSGDGSESLASLSAEQFAGLYDHVAADYARLGITKAAALGNMAALRAYNHEVEPFKLACERAVAGSPDPAVRDAGQAYETALSTQHPPGTPLREIHAQRQAGLRAYEAAIGASGDQHLITAWRAYQEAVRTATARYAQALR